MSVSSYGTEVILRYSPRVPAAKLLTQVRNQQSESLKDTRMLALGIILDGFVEDLVDSLVAVVCALLLNWVGNPIRDSISCRHGCV
jgi:hypothetical protein